MKSLLIIVSVVILTLCCQAADSSQVPEPLCGAWVLDGFMADDGLKAPKIRHFLFLDSSGKLVRTSGLNDDWQEDKAQKVSIDSEGHMTMHASDGAKIPLGTARIQKDGKLHLIAQGGEHHLVYSAVDPMTIK